MDILVISGATATGKSALAVKLAKKYGGEIISADSVAVYRGMDIGSAKISAEEMEGIPHHLIDILDPDEPYSVADFCARAKDAVSAIRSRGHLPIIVGGTGFYIRAFLFDTDFSDGESDGAIRERLQQIADKDDGETLYGMLCDTDPDYAATVHKNNIKRVIRALEYHELTGELFSAYNEKERQKTSPYDYRHYCLTMPRSILYPRINDRVDQMIEAGLYDEVRALSERGYGRDLQSMQAIGYKEMYDHLCGEKTLDEAIYAIKLETRHFAKRQETWFKREKNVKLIDVSTENGFDIITKETSDE